MSYRDDVDALYNRSVTLQREVDEMRAQLAERDRKLAERDDTQFRAADTSPGLRELRKLPSAEELMARLLGGIGQPEPRYPEFRGTAPLGAMALPPEPPRELRREKVLDQTRDRLGALTDEQLVLIGAVVEALDEHDVMEALRDLAARVVR